MILCNKHGEQLEFTLGEKYYCPICVQSIFDVRIDNYILEE